MTLAFLALLGAPYIYEISSLRVNNAVPSINVIQALQRLQEKNHRWLANTGFEMSRL